MTPQRPLQKTRFSKIAEEARYDGLFVLRTNAGITPLQAVLRYRELLSVEALFRAAKASFDTRPIFHSSDAAIRGHVFCSFLALLLQKEPFEICADAGMTAEWANLLRGLDRLQEATVESGGKTWTVRNRSHRRNFSADEVRRDHAARPRPGHLAASGGGCTSTDLTKAPGTAPA